MRDDAFDTSNVAFGYEWPSPITLFREGPDGPVLASDHALLGPAEARSYVLVGPGASAQQGYDSDNWSLSIRVFREGPGASLKPPSAYPNQSESALYVISDDDIGGASGGSNAPSLTLEQVRERLRSPECRMVVVDHFPSHGEHHADSLEGAEQLIDKLISVAFSGDLPGSDHE